MEVGGTHLKTISSGTFQIFSKISKISVLIIHDSSFSGKSVPWTLILRFFVRLIFICICIVLRSPNKNTILHAGQKIGKKLGVLRAFATYKMTITMTFGDFFRLISIFICIAWRSPNKNTFWHMGQK